MCLSPSSVTHIHQVKTDSRRYDQFLVSSCPFGLYLMLGNEWQLLLIESSERPNTFLNVFMIINLMVVLLISLIHTYYHLAPLI